MPAEGEEEEEEEEEEGGPSVEPMPQEKAAWEGGEKAKEAVVVAAAKEAAKGVASTVLAGASHLPGARERHKAQEPARSKAGLEHEPVHGSSSKIDDFAPSRPAQSMIHLHVKPLERCTPALFELHDSQQTSKSLPIASIVRLKHVQSGKWLTTLRVPGPTLEGTSRVAAPPTKVHAVLTDACYIRDGLLIERSGSVTQTFLAVSGAAQQLSLEAHEVEAAGDTLIEDRPYLVSCLRYLTSYMKDDEGEVRARTAHSGPTSHARDMHNSMHDIRTSPARSPQPCNRCHLHHPVSLSRGQRPSPCEDGAAQCRLATYSPRPKANPTPDPTANSTLRSLRLTLPLTLPLTARSDP